MVARINLVIASFDGGGARTFSQLEIIRAIMHRLKWERYPNEPDKIILPCEHFDLIGGSGTGGLIAIFLARLYMSVEEATDEFSTIVEVVYKPEDLTPLERTQRLRGCLEDCMKRKEFPLDLKLMVKNQTERCASFVVASPRISAATKVCLRAYPIPSQLPSEVTVIEAVLATCAAQPMFAPALSGSGYKRRAYIGAGLGANNPVRELITEAHSLFGGDSSVSRLLSLGTGNPGIISFPEDGGDISLRRLRDMMNDCEQRAQEIEQHIGRLGIYFRFSVGQGMQNDYPNDVVDPGWVGAQTEIYLADHINYEKIGTFVQNTASLNSVITLDQLKYAGGAGISSSATLEAVLTFTTSSHGDAVLAKLKPTDLECSSRVTECMNGTRKDIFARIMDWVGDFEASNILWIKGYPGIGKSAIASSLVERLRKLERLGSSFFFQRQSAAIMTPNALWRTVAYDLARQYPTIQKHLVATLEGDETIPTTVNIEKLFRQLVHEPLMAIGAIPLERYPIIVVDALDECGGLEGPNSEDRKTLMRTLGRWSHLPRKFKLIVTSREENDIGRLFSKTSHRPIEICSGDAVTPESSHDIRLFLEDQLRQIAAQYPKSLSPDWPGYKTINVITEKATGLFIWAKTVVRFVTRGEPGEQLRKILEGSGTGDMGALYSWILNASFPSPSEDIIKSLRSVLGATILAKTALAASSVEDLFSITGSTMEYICNGLQSVMDSRDLLHFNHQSFADFLLDASKCHPDFLIERERESRNLTLACLDTMRINLKFNICGLETSYIRNSDVPDLESRVEECILPHLSYTCRFWTSHLVETTFDNEVHDRLLYFMDHQFLSWLEVLSLIKQVNIGSTMLHLLTDWMRTHGQDDVMASDMQKFISAFASVISQSTPHIYLSALPFSPRTSHVLKQYMTSYPRILTIRSGGLSDWPAIQNVLSGHNCLILSVAFSPDGRRIASGSADKTIRVWDAETGDVVAGPFEGHDKVVTSVAFSPGGRRIVSGSGDTTIRVWDAKTGDAVAGPFGGHTDWVRSVTFSHDGRRIVSGADDKTIRVWDVKTGQVVVGPIEAHSRWIRSVALSPDGRKIVSGSHDGTIRVWDAQKGQEIAGPFKGHTHWITSVTFSPDGRSIVSGSHDRTIRVWDAETGDEIVQAFRGHTRGIWSVAFSPDGRRIASGSHDKTIRVWDAQAGEVIAGPFKGHTDWIRSVAFSPDGMRIASGSYDKTIRVWDPETSEALAGPLEGHDGVVTSVAFSPDGVRIVSGSYDGTIRVWDAKTGQLIARSFEGHASKVWSVAFSPDGLHIASGSEDKTIRLWNAEIGNVITAPFEGHTDGVWCIAFSPDASRIVSGSDDKTIRVWDGKTGRVIAGPFEGHAGGVWSVAFSPDGRYIVSGSDDKTIRVWNSETSGVIAGPFEGHDGIIASVAFSPDGTCIVSGSYDGTIRMWDAKMGEVIAGPFEGHADWITSVAFSPDGRCIVSGSDDKTIRVWDAETGRIIAGPLEGHEGAVTSVAFSPGGRYIVSGSADMTIRAWDLESIALFDQDKIVPYFNDSSKMEDGWILGQSSQLLFWVPPSIRTGLRRPSHKIAIGKFVTTLLSVEKFVHGENWVLCRK